MRLAAAAIVISAIGCASEPQTVKVRWQPKSGRPLITDSLPFLAERALVHAYMRDHDWCQQRTWDHSEDFAICDDHPYLNQSTPPMHTIIGYDSSERATAYAVF